MSVNGLEKITERILADAKAESEARLAKAETECQRIEADAKARAEALRRSLSDEAEQKAETFIAGVRSSAAMQKNNLLLARKYALVDEVFTSVLEQTVSMERGKYTELLAGLAAAAVLEHGRIQAENQALCGDDEEIEEDPDANAPLELMLNKKDRDTCGEAVLELTRQKVRGKISEELTASLCLCPQICRFQGGVVLRCGFVEYNCTLETVFSELRRELEHEVETALFDFKGNGL